MLLTALLWSCAHSAQDALRYAPKGRTALVEWEFSKDGTTWETVTVPHSYNAIDGRSAQYYRGPATYRRTIDIWDPERPAYLLFEGAAQKATVRVNGREACVHKGGYTAFAVNLKGLLVRGENTVEVVCDNTEDIDMIPVSSDFNKNGGLHNPAWLYVPAGDVYFDPAEFGPYRLHVTQENVSESSADVTVKASVHGKADVTLKVRNAAGKVVYKHTKNDVSGAYEHAFTLENPHLWNGVEDPYLYTVELSAGDDDAVALGKVVPLNRRYKALLPFALPLQVYRTQTPMRHPDKPLARPQRHPARTPHARQPHPMHPDFVKPPDRMPASLRRRHLNPSQRPLQFLSIDDIRHAVHVPQLAPVAHGKHPRDLEHPIRLTRLRN